MGSKRRPTPTIEQWYVQFCSGESSQPWSERKQRVCGVVYGHPSRPDGSAISTSYVVEMVDLVATTASGSRYRLATPYESQRRYRELTSPGWDWRNPLQEPGVTS